MVAIKANQCHDGFGVIVFIRRFLHPLRNQGEKTVIEVMSPELDEYWGSERRKHVEEVLNALVGHAAHNADRQFHPT